MGDGAKLAAVIIGAVLMLNQCENGDAMTNARIGAAAAGVGAGVAAGGAVGAAASGAAKGLGQRAQDKASGRNRPNGPSRPSPATTIPASAPTTTSPMESDFDLCTALVELPGCVVSR